MLSNPANNRLGSYIFCSNHVHKSNRHQIMETHQSWWWYGKIKEIVAADTGPWSEIRSFTVALPPGVPGPVSPKINAKEVSLTPLFDWSGSTPSAGTTLLKYEQQISTDSAFASPLSVDAINQMRRLDIFTPCQISDGARQFHASRAMIRSRR